MTIYCGVDFHARQQTVCYCASAGGEISLDPGPQIKSGARLVREWRGRTHTVTVTEEGFQYDGRHYPSLTQIARAITGAHWSGPRFFGLKKPEREALARRP